MAKFDGIKCDGCGKVVEVDAAVEKLTRYKSRESVQGECTNDLCVECAEKDVAGKTLKPWPRMKGEAAQPSNGPDDPLG